MNGSGGAGGGTTTVGDVLRYLFPKGTSKQGDLAALPPLPDTFLVGAYLVKTCGIAPFVLPGSQDAGSHECPSHEGFLCIPPGIYVRGTKAQRLVRTRLSQYGEAVSRYEKYRLKVSKKLSAGATLSDAKLRRNVEEMTRAKKDAAKAVRAADEIVRKAVRPLWQELVCEHWHSPLVTPARTREERREDPVEPWWTTALSLLVLSDMLCDGIGFSGREREAKIPPSVLALVYVNERLAKVYDTPGTDPGSFMDHTLAIWASAEVATVLPKSHIPKTGCTVRSLSHNLALLPPVSATGAYWDPVSVSGQTDRTPLNILLVPIPYYMSAHAFCVEQPFDNRDWGYFHITPHWLDNTSAEAFVTFVQKLCERTKDEVGKVDAVVFPEAALKTRHFSALETAVTNARKGDALHEVEFVIGGLCDDEDGNAGNFVRVASVFERTENGAQLITARQGKHHRWRLDAPQIREYRLSHVLNEGLGWWENLPPKRREVNFFRFRNTSSFVTLICEDLARLDPGQEVLRAVGPDLVIALLMDSVQINGRWPARYATVLADDPGSSVLTLTSMALIERSNDKRALEYSSSEKRRCIALWRDAKSGSTEIDLPEEASAVVVTIANDRRQASTLDGRPADMRPSWIWRLADQRPIRLNGRDFAAAPPFGKDRRRL